MHGAAHLTAIPAAASAVDVAAGTPRPHPDSAMSSALALASVTAVLKSVLENGLAARGVAGALGGDVGVSALPPDRVGAGGGDERAQLNVFLYLVTPHPRLRAPALVGRAPDGAAPGDTADAPPLALDLHYLLTAYGAQDYHAEVLLGHALQLLHERPTLGREAVGAALAALSDGSDGRVVPPALAALRALDVGEQVEELRITPEFQSAEDAAKLWSGLQAKYRPSAAYKVSAVLIGASAEPPRPRGDDASEAAAPAASGATARSRRRAS